MHLGQHRVRFVSTTQAHLEWVCPRENRDKWHVGHGDKRADDPCPEVQASEPVLLYRARVDEEEPETKLFQMRDPVEESGSASLRRVDIGEYTHISRLHDIVKSK